MSDRLGIIYLITNKINGVQYVGQTSRNIAIRFDEHWWDKHMTPLHQAMHEYGQGNFIIKEIERVPLDQLDEAEKRWVAYYDTYHNGYNATPGGRAAPFPKTYKHLKVIENNFIFDSAIELSKMLNEINQWNSDYLVEQIRNAVKNKTEFLGYHFEDTDCEDLVSIDEATNWIKTLNVRFCGKHIYCNELDKEFDTIASAAKYMIDNNLYQGTSRTPVQALVTSISYQLNKKTDYVNSSIGNLTFVYAPGTTKLNGSEEPGVCKKVYCPEIDKIFESQKEAAQYFLDEGIWKNIKLKTAKLRISDVVNGNFPDYKGYTFTRVE